MHKAEENSMGGILRCWEIGCWKEILDDGIIRKKLDLFHDEKEMELIHG